MRLARTSGRVAGKENPADAGAKALDQEAINRCMQKFGVRSRGAAGFGLDEAGTALVAMLVFQAPEAAAESFIYTDEYESQGSSPIVTMGLVFVAGMCIGAIGGLLCGAVAGGLLAKKMQTAKLKTEHEELLLAKKMQKAKLKTEHEELETRVVKAKAERDARTQLRTKATQTRAVAQCTVGSQSPVTYLRQRATPRFQPLGWHQWG